MENTIEENPKPETSKEASIKPARPSINPLLLIGGGVIAGILLLLLVLNSMSYVSTDDAVIDGHSIPISPKVSAHVLKILVDDNQKVNQGEVLLQLNSEDYEVAKEKAQADLDEAIAEQQQAKRDFERYQALAQKEEVSKQQLDKAQLRVETDQAQTLAMQAALKQAELNVSYTKIIAPVTGYVTKKTVQEGEFVQVGQSLMSVVSTQMWVTADFKETDLTNMRPGQKVSITIDSYPGKTFEGHLDSIQHGTGSVFTLFPPENATGNFVKVVQRVPVKIVFDNLPDISDTLALGMSVVCKIKVR